MAHMAVTGEAATVAHMAGAKAEIEVVSYMCCMDSGENDGSSPLIQLSCPKLPTHNSTWCQPQHDELTHIPTSDVSFDRSLEMVPLMALP